MNPVHYSSERQDWATPFFEAPHGSLYCGDSLDVLRSLPSESVQCCVTSPPYWGLRDYAAEGQIGLEETMQQHIERLVCLFREVRRVLSSDGTLWLNYGDTYLRQQGKGFNGNKRLDEANRSIQVKSPLPPKNLLGLPWRIAFALQEDGWILRQDIIWQKPNPMPESVTDRCTKAHEYVFLLAKSPKYYFDNEAIKEPADPKSNLNWARPGGQEAERPGQVYGQHRDREKNSQPGFTRNKRSVWTVATRPFPEAHFATFPPELIQPCILAGTRPGDVVLDPFMGSGTTGMVARKLGRKWLGIEINPDFCRMALNRIDVNQMSLLEVSL